MSDLQSKPEASLDWGTPLAGSSGGDEQVPWMRGGLQKWGLCESLVARSQACRHRDPEQMILLAERAVAVAAELDPMEYGPERTADLRARTLAELANAHRVADDLEAAERAMRQAVAWLFRGSQDPLLLARIMDLTASLRGYQRRFGEALDLLDTVYRLYESHGDRHNAGRALISKGLYTGYDNAPEQAIELLGAGLAMIHPAADPRLVISAVHNLMNFLSDCGRFRQAARLLRRSRRAYLAQNDPLNLIKLSWLEGKIDAGLGRFRRAEKSLRQARRDFASLGLDYHAALVSLDLSMVLLNQGKTAEARELIEETVAPFRARQIAREALAALLLLKESFETEKALSLELLQVVAKHLERSKRPLV